MALKPLKVDVALEVRCVKRFDCVAKNGLADPVALGRHTFGCGTENVLVGPLVLGGHTFGCGAEIAIVDPMALDVESF